jgi:hypothetical protein
MDKAFTYQDLPTGTLDHEDMDPDMLPDMNDASSVENPDGSMDITFGEEDTDPAEIPFDANLAEYLEDQELTQLAADLIPAFEDDKRSREPWEEIYQKGLDLLGMKTTDRTRPWNGASGVFHPMLMEAVVRHQAQSIGEIFPASGPTKHKIQGAETPDLLKQARRMVEEMNFQLTEKMKEYRTETEMLLFHQPLSGSAFRKVYYREDRKRGCSMFVPADDFVVAYGTSTLQDCPRATHVLRQFPNEVKKLQKSGWYLDCELPKPIWSPSDTKTAEDTASGTSPIIERDDRYVLLEMMVDYDLPGQFSDPDGIEQPYVITIDYHNQKVLSIRRNWREEDPDKNKRQHFVHYPYITGLGFYGLGLIHLIGGLTKGATSLLRQLIDAGTLANLPGGLKSRSLRIKGDESPIEPGEWRDVDVPIGAIRDSIFPLPYKEPSAVLMNLLTMVVDEGRRLASIADQKIADVSSQTPVGTILAILERNLKIMTSVQSRLHASLREELGLLREIIAEYMPSQYDYTQEGQFDRKQDFASGVEILPVTDPNATTMAQKVVQYQAAMQNAAQAPNIYNQKLLHRGMLEALQIKDAEKIIPMDEEMKPTDPVTENMKVLNQQPVKAFINQNHDAHLAVHTSALQDPKLQAVVGQSPFAQAIEAALQAHILEHVAYQYRSEIERQLGVSLPPEGETLPDDIESNLSSAIAQAADKVLGINRTEMAAQKAQEAQNDPLVQIQLMEAHAKLLTAQAGAGDKEKRVTLDGIKHHDQMAKGEADIESRERIAALQAGVQLAIHAEETDHQKELAEMDDTANLALEHLRGRNQIEAVKAQPKPPAKPSGGSK